MNTNEFSALGINADLCRALESVGYVSPTPIQTQAIPILLDGADLLGIAQTGTGKTAAFSLPMLQRLQESRTKCEPKKPRALVLAPTRELAVQIHSELENFNQHTNLRLACIFGGVNQNPQVRKLAKGIDIVVATPGRLLDLSNQGHLQLDAIEILVLDEADRLLDMGFIRDVKKIVAKMPRQRQSLLFSATMPKEVNALAQEILHKPERVDVAPKEVTVAKVKQKVVFVDNPRKRAVLEALLFDSSVTRAIVFTRTKHGANKVAKQLMASGITAEAIHGNKSQNARQRALQAFKDGECWVLVATDIAARGIDIDGVSHVINYELPHEPESYVHRIGRTGRAGATGEAWALVDAGERSRLKVVERLIKLKIPVVQMAEAQADPNAVVPEVVDLGEMRKPRRRPGPKGQNQQKQGQRSGGQGGRGQAQGNKQQSNTEANGNQASSSSDGGATRTAPPKRRRRRSRAGSSA